MTDQIAHARDYHRETSYTRHRIKGHALDFNRYPVPYKSYDYINTVKIQDKGLGSDADLQALFAPGYKPRDRQPLDRDVLFSILSLGYGVRDSVQSGPILFFLRTVPSAGGLYPCHLYLLVQGMEDLETGVYYCDLIHQTLGLIQKLDLGQVAVHEPKASLIVTAQFYNSAWKYGDRAFRYMLLDSGHLIESICLAAASCGWEPKVTMDMDDDAVSRMLSLGKKEEVPMAVISLDGQFEVPPLLGDPAKVNDNPQFLPSINFLKTVYDIGKDKQSPAHPIPSRLLSDCEVQAIALNALYPKDQPEMQRFGKAVVSRTSQRNFVRDELAGGLAGELIRMAASRYQFMTADRTGLVLGMTCQHVQGLDDGFYLFSHDARSLVLKQPGQFHQSLAHVCLDQMWMAEAGIHFLLMADLETVEKHWGPRGYRYLFMEAGRVGHRIYLGASALGLGCCAVGAIYDWEAQDLLGLNKEVALFYVVSTGCVKKYPSGN